jgi:hypothetical protein
VLLIAAERELAPAGRVWGTGGWVVPEDREALDWLALGRLLGWEVAVASADRAAGALAGRRWIVAALDPDALSEDVVARLGALLREEPALLIARAGAAGGRLAGLAGAARSGERFAARELCWRGPGPPVQQRSRALVECERLSLSPEAEVWAELEGAPVAVARAAGRGRVVTLGFHPSAARDADGAFTALAKRILVWGALGPVAWLDLAGALVLRMDDPGGAQNVHSAGWSHPKLAEPAWRSIGASLRRRRARLSIAYVAGWVDDGDPARGALRVDGREVARRPGAVHPSPAVRYEDRAGHAPGTLHDYASEFRGIQQLRAAGLAEVELHGYTHMHPDGAAWASAPDRYEAVAWYRELGAPAREALAATPPERHPLALGLAAFERWFATRPAALVCPGDQWTDEVVERALALGFELVSSYYLGLRDGARLCWAQHVCAPYLDLPDPAWFAGELPVVGTFHDRDLALHGTAWLDAELERWQAAGARCCLDLRELASALRLRLRAFDDGASGLALRVAEAAQGTLVRPVPIGIRAGAGPLPSHLRVILGRGNRSLEVETVAPGVGRVRLPG